jgi:uncharacterized protein (TIGR03067 family)
MSEALLHSTTRAASLFAAGQATGAISASVAALTDGVVKALFLTKCKITMALLLGVAVLGAGVGTALLNHGAQAGEPPIGQERLVTKAEPAKAPLPKKATDVGQLSSRQMQQGAKTDAERLVGGWVIVNDDTKRKGELWEIGQHQIVMNANLLGFRTTSHFHRLDAAKSPKQIDITVTVIAGVYGPDVPIKADARIVGVIKGIYSLDDDGELRLCLGEMGKDRPAKFPERPKPGEVLILHGPPGAKASAGAVDVKEKLRVLIDKVLAAHGGEDRLKKLHFTMTVKHSNGYINQYFVQLPKNFRWETTFPNQTGKRIVILFPEGRRWWTKEPNEDAKGFIPTGIEAPLRFWHDYVKFFGPLQVLRLNDADHKVALLDEEAKIGDRAAVGVQITGPLCTQKMYFDKETHLLLKGVGSDIVREVTFSDYKKSDGFPIAQQEHDGHFEPRVTDFRAVDKFDPKLFENPNVSYQTKPKEEPAAKADEERMAGNKTTSAWGAECAGLRCRAKVIARTEQGMPLDVVFELECNLDRLKPNVKLLNMYLPDDNMEMTLTSAKTGKVWTVRPYDPTRGMVVEDVGKTTAALDGTKIKPLEIRFPLVRLGDDLEPDAYDCRVRYALPAQGKHWREGQAAWQDRGFWQGTVETGPVRVQVKKQTLQTVKLLLPKRLSLLNGLNIHYTKDDAEQVEVKRRNGYFIAARYLEYKGKKLTGETLTAVPTPEPVNPIGNISNYKGGDRETSITVEIFETADPPVHLWHPGPGSGGYRVLWSRTFTLSWTEKEIRQRQ